ncbi:MAG: FHA domain-containing [Planctomycetota bacterium]|nr:MAG: FHA domain-containing [Planctomycetota bacterium]
MPKIVHTESGATREYTLGAVAITVGRAARHTIPTMDSRASRDHFKIELVAGGYVATDMGSRNGTLLNGEVLEKPRTLRAGDRLMIGAAVFQFQDGTMTTPAPESSEGAPMQALTTRDVAEPVVEQPVPAASPALVPVPAQAPVPAAPSYLEVVHSDGSTASHRLGATPLVIGRAKECTLAIDDEKLSSRHVEVSETDQGILVKDLKSTNGTRFDGEKFETRLLRDREKFIAGSVTFRIAAPRFGGTGAAAKKSRRPGPVALAIFAALLILGGAAIVAPSLIGNFVDLPPTVAADPDNLLGAAGSLERGQEGWTISADANYQVAADREQHKDGGFSLAVRGVDTRVHSLFAASSASVPLPPGGALKLEGWVRAMALEGRAGLRIDWLRGETLAGTTTTDLHEGTFDWKRVSVVAVAPPGADRARAACIVAGIASATWFDALKLSATKETPGGAGWPTAWGRLTIDDVAALRIDLANAPLLWNGTLWIEEKGYPTTPTPLWLGERDGEPMSVGTGFRTTRKIARLGSVTLFGVHADLEDSVSWQVDVAMESAVIFTADLDPAVAARMTTRTGELVEPRDGPFEASRCSEIVLGDAPSVLFDTPADVKLEGTRLRIRWSPRPAEVALRLRPAASWVEREVRELLADANAASRASQLGKALVIFEDLGKRYPEREEGRTGASRGKELRAQAEEVARKARAEVSNAKKYPSKSTTQIALDLIDQLERQWDGSEFAAEGARLRQAMSPESVEKPPDETTRPPDETPKPPPKEPVENAQTLLKWAEEAIAKEEWLKAEIFARNVMDRWPGTPEEMKAGELLGRATSGGKAARDRDAWIRETLTKARNLVKNRQSDKAAPLFEEVLKKYPDSPLVKGVKEELEKIRR